MFIKTLISASIAMLLTVASASAATVKLDFDSGTFTSNSYIQDGFTVTVTNPGSISTSSDCPDPKCLKLSNNQIATITYAGGSYILNSFIFNGKGDDGAFDFYVDGAYHSSYSESANGNTMATGSPNAFVLASSYFIPTFDANSNGSARIDDIIIDFTAVPLPAAGFLLMAGLGGLGIAGRRRKKS